MQEKDLVIRFSEAQARKAAAKLEEAEAEKELNNVERELVEFLQAGDKTSTARYEGIGFCTMKKPVIRASCLVDNKPDLFEYLESISRGDMIKRDVHSGTLSTFVKEMLLEGEELPKIINYYLQTKIGFYKR